MLNLYMHLADVIATPRDCLYQELLEVHILMDKVFDGGKSRVNGTVPRGQWRYAPLR